MEREREAEKAVAVRLGIRKLHLRNHFILKDEARPKIWQKESCVHTHSNMLVLVSILSRGVLVRWRAAFSETRFFLPIENSINSGGKSYTVG